jgi:nucleoside-diphosphate-sugar epimerase
MTTDVLILGGGFTGIAVAKQALAKGLSVVATTRSEARAQALEALGVKAVIGALDEATVRGIVGSTTRALVTIPPEIELDRAIARGLAGAASHVYVSSTAVYGRAHGVVDEDTPVDADGPRAAARIDAERTHREAGASIVRAPGIYGPGRGMHLRVARRELAFSSDTTSIVSRVHVDDLGAMLLRLLLTPRPREVFVAGDREPASHADVAKWIAAKLGVELTMDAPPNRTFAGRTANPSRALAEGVLTLAYPTYREGYADCIERDLGSR